MSQKRKKRSEIVYERPPLRQRLVSNPRRWTTRAVGVVAWVVLSALLMAMLQLESIAGVLLLTGVGAVAGILFVGVVKPSAHRIELMDDEVVVTTRRGDHFYLWSETAEVALVRSRFVHAHEFGVGLRPGATDDVVVRVDQQAWAQFSDRLSGVAKRHGVPVRTK